MPRLFSIGKGERKMFRWGEHLEALGNGVSVLVNETHHFGTDTILLADFCLPVKGKQAVELGAGCGAISMIWLREQPLPPTLPQWKFRRKPWTCCAAR